MPEAAVDEYGNSLARKNNIRTAGQILTISFLAIAERPGDPTDNPLRCRVPRLHSPHDAATLSCGKRVHIFSKFNLPECLVQCPLSWCRSELGEVKSEEAEPFYDEGCAAGERRDCRRRRVDSRHESIEGHLNESSARYADVPSCKMAEGRRTARLRRRALQGNRA